MENKVIDIEAMKNNSSSVSEETALGNLLRRLESVDSNVDYTEALNVFLDTSVKNDLLKFIKPNERTHTSLVNSHVKMGQFESAIQVLNEQKETISVSGLIYLPLLLTEFVAITFFSCFCFSFHIRIAFNLSKTKGN